MGAYAHPEVLVGTDWVSEHLQDPNVRLVEIDVDTTAYDAGHIPGAVGLSWTDDLNDPVRRDIISKEQFERLMGSAGIGPGDTLVLYGDNANWFAAFGFWLFKIYGHADVRLMDGGRQKWLDEEEKPMTVEVPHPEPSVYTATEARRELRARLEEVRSVAGNGAVNLIDVRSPEEFSGEVIAPAGMSETAQRGGHIPGARSVPWSKAVARDGTFRPFEELRAIYLEGGGGDPQRPTITYCRIGERSSHTWFVLRYLLGLDDVKNYDGSWTEYGNVVGLPIER